MNFAIIAAAGKGRRMGKNVNKVFLPLLNKPVIYYAIKNFQDCDLIDEIVVVTVKGNIKKIRDMADFYGFSKVKNIIEGGKERQDSVYKGMISIRPRNAENDIVVVHNGGNPLVKEIDIAGCINAAKMYGAAVAGFQVRDTIKKAGDGFVEKTIDRVGLYHAQTPQAARYGLFAEAFRNAKKKKLAVTDDVSLVEALGKKVKIVPCSHENLKITAQDDLRIAEGILMKRLMKSGSANFGFRVGFGQDSHRFGGKSKKLVIGGHVIPNEAGLEADSDGDVVLHALFNAISQAIGERSLGYYADGMCKNGITDSREYLKVILNKLSQKGLKIGNVGIMIEAGKPKLEQHTGRIKHSLSEILKLGKGDIGITYTSGDGLTTFGQGRGIQCFAVVSIINS